MEQVVTAEGLREQTQPNISAPTIDAHLMQTVEELRTLEKKNLRINRLKLLFLLATLIVCIVAALFVYANIASTVRRIDEMSESLTEAGKNINAVAKDLEKFDFDKLSASLQSIVDTSESTVGEVYQAAQGLSVLLEDADVAMNHINAVDIEKLNDGIRQLNDILEPIASFFRVAR